MQTPDPVRAVPAFQFQPTVASDIEAIELIAARSTRRVPTGLLSSLADPEQKLVTLWAAREIVGFVRFKIKNRILQWTDLVVDPEYLNAKDLDAEVKRGILEQAKQFAAEKALETVSTLPGLMIAPNRGQKPLF